MSYIGYFVTDICASYVALIKGIVIDLENTN